MFKSNLIKTTQAKQGQNYKNTKSNKNLKLEVQLNIFSLLAVVLESTHLYPALDHQQKVLAEAAYIEENTSTVCSRIVQEISTTYMYSNINKLNLSL